MSYYKFNENPDKENPHYCFGEELLVPWTENSDTQRLNMWSSHINQTVHLKAPEYPKVFTNFEDQFGEYSVAYKEAPEEFKIIKRIYKNEFNYVTIIQYTKSKVFDLIWNHSANRITEDYGYKLNDCIKEKPEGSIVHQGEQVYKSDNYDADGNFMYGVNLKAVYLPYKGMTYEDGIVISKSAAAKMTSYKVEETSFSVNNNDVLINIYGDENVYKSFPHVGDDIHKKVLVAIRRRASMSQIYSFQSAQLRKIDFFTDSIIYTGGGKVTDIEIYSNKSLEEFRKMKSKAEDEHRELDSFTKEIIELLEQQQSFYAELAEELEKIIPAVYYNKAEAEKLYLEEDKKIDKSVSRIASRNIDRNFSQVAHALPAEDNPNRYTDNIAYWWKISHENINDNIAWRDDGNTFANFKMKFTILKENPLTAGCKLSGRYGNKGVVTLIEDDDKMPITVDGIRADVCLNPLG